MSGAACKEAWCRQKAQKTMTRVCDTLNEFKEHDLELSIKVSEIYIKKLNEAEKEASQLI